MSGPCSLQICRAALQVGLDGGNEFQCFGARTVGVVGGNAFVDGAVIGKAGMAEIAHAERMLPKAVEHAHASRR